MIESTVGASAADSVPFHATSRSGFGVSVPDESGFVVAAAFWIPKPFGFGLVTVTWVAASSGRKFCATTEHAALEPLGNVVGEHEWVSRTPPCCLKNATGRKTSFAFAFAASRAIEPKYCWSAASPSPSIVIVSVFVCPDAIVKLAGFTRIDPPAGASACTVNFWLSPLTFRATASW